MYTITYILTKLGKDSCVKHNLNDTIETGIHWFALKKTWMVKYFSNKRLTREVRGYVHCILCDVSQIIGHIDLFLIKKERYLVLLHGGNTVYVLIP